MMQTDFITRKMVQETTETVAWKNKPVSLPLVRFESFQEGKAAQILYIGPFPEEGPTIEQVHTFIEDHGSERVGKHHEIFLADPRQTAPGKWETIVRQAMTSK